LRNPRLALRKPVTSLDMAEDSIGLRRRRRNMPMRASRMADPSLRPARVGDSRGAALTARWSRMRICAPAADAAPLPLEP